MEWAPRWSLATVESCWPAAVEGLSVSCTRNGQQADGLVFEPHFSLWKPWSFLTFLLFLLCDSQAGQEQPQL